MQATRQHILQILEELGQATVDDLVSELKQRRGEITAVTVRHHLTVLQQENLITAPQQMERDTPGRPKHIYMLAHQDNFERLAGGLMDSIRRNLPTDSANVIFEGVADSMANEAAIQGDTLEERLKQVVNYMNKHGYNARYETAENGFILYTYNCPYHQLAKEDGSLCNMDMRLISSMLGVVPRLLSTVSKGHESCAYHIPE